MNRPFGPGSVSIGLHPLSGLPAQRQISTILDWAVTAEAHGFDGVTMSEHHAGFPAYMPQPLLCANWILERTSRLWAGPAAMVLGLRNPVQVAEEIAWTAARHPGRVGAVFAPGYVTSDFEALEVPYDDVSRFPEKLATVAAALTPQGAIGKDAAVTAWAADPGPILSTGNSRAAIRRAASHPGMGIVFPGAVNPERLGRLSRLYHESGGNGPTVGIRALWVGTPPETPESVAARKLYEASAAPGMTQAKGFDDWMLTGPADHVIEQTAAWMRTAEVAAINVRVNVPGVEPAQIAEQIAVVGEQVIPGLRQALG